MLLPEAKNHPEIKESTAWQETRKELQRFVYHKVRDREKAEDIVQDVLVKALTRLDQLHDLTKLKGWLFRIAQNEIIDSFRKQDKILHEHELDWDSADSDVEECVTGCLNSVIQTLPEKYREAMLAEIEGVPQALLAEKLNISYSGAKSRVQRARQMVKEKMESQLRVEVDSYGNVVACVNLGRQACPPGTSGECERR